MSDDEKIIYMYIIHLQSETFYITFSLFGQKYTHYNVGVAYIILTIRFHQTK